jgi:hypothetical protein
MSKVRIIAMICPEHGEWTPTQGWDAAGRPLLPEAIEARYLHGLKSHCGRCERDGRGKTPVLLAVEPVDG